MRSKVLAAFIALVVLVGLAGCKPGKPSASNSAKGQSKVAQQNKSFKPPVIKNFTEYHNYMSAQKLYDDPSSIIWCTTSFGNPSSPILTVPVAGKLTSSSVSLFPNTVQKDYQYSGVYNPELPSVDSMYHGSPPPYRYGFTPGGQYVDFFDMPTFCTTALTSFQRASTNVTITVDPKMVSAQAAAEEALAKCAAGNSKTVTKSTNCPAAQAALQSGLGQ